MPTDVPEFLEIWSAYNERSVWERVIAKGGNEEASRQALAAVPEVSALDALKANRDAVDLLVGQRWYVMQSAREAGATWEAIGGALGITKQGAQDYYRRQIEKQEKFLPDLHDTARARKVLDEGSSDR